MFDISFVKITHTHTYCTKRGGGGGEEGKINSHHRTSDLVIVTGCPTLARTGVSRTDSILKDKKKGSIHFHTNLCFIMLVNSDKRKTVRELFRLMKL